MSPRVHTNDSDTIILGLYTIFIVYQIMNGRTYRKPHRALPYHVVAGLMEVGLYYSGISCSILAIVACYVHSLTSLSLVKRLRKGYPPLTKPSYQAGSIMRMAYIIYAFITQDPMDYHDAMMPLHGFVYTRALLFVFSTMGPTRDFNKNINSKHVYSLSVTGAALLAVSHCSSPWAPLYYTIIVNFLGKLEAWSRRHYEALCQEKKAIPGYLRFLRSAGFFAFDRPSAIEMQSDLDDGPKVGDLPMDYLGHLWAAWA